MISPMTPSGKYDEIVGDDVAVKLMHRWLKNYNGTVVTSCCLSITEGFSNNI